MDAMLIEIAEKEAAAKSPEATEARTRALVSLLFGRGEASTPPPSSAASAPSPPLLEGETSGSPPPLVSCLKPSSYAGPSPLASPSKASSFAFGGGEKKKAPPKKPKFDASTVNLAALAEGMGVTVGDGSGGAGGDGKGSNAKKGGGTSSNANSSSAGEHTAGGALGALFQRHQTSREAAARARRVGRQHMLADYAELEELFATNAASPSRTKRRPSSASAAGPAMAVTAGQPSTSAIAANGAGIRRRGHTAADGAAGEPAETDGKAGSVRGKRRQLTFVTPPTRGNKAKDRQRGSSSSSSSGADDNANSNTNNANNNPLLLASMDIPSAALTDDGLLLEAAGWGGDSDSASTDSEFADAHDAHQTMLRDVAAMERRAARQRRAAAAAAAAAAGGGSLGTSAAFSTSGSGSNDEGALNSRSSYATAESGGTTNTTGGTLSNSTASSGPLGAMFRTPSMAVRASSQDSAATTGTGDSSSVAGLGMGGGSGHLQQQQSFLISAMAKRDKNGRQREGVRSSSANKAKGEGGEEKGGGSRKEERPLPPPLHLPSYFTTSPLYRKTFRATFSAPKELPVVSTPQQPQQPKRRRLRPLHASQLRTIEQERFALADDDGAWRRSGPNATTLAVLPPVQSVLVFDHASPVLPLQQL